MSRYKIKRCRCGRKAVHIGFGMAYCHSCYFNRYGETKD